MVLCRRKQDLKIVDEFSAYGFEKSSNFMLMQFIGTVKRISELGLNSSVRVNKSVQVN